MEALATMSVLVQSVWFSISELLLVFGLTFVLLAFSSGIVVFEIKAILRLASGWVEQKSQNPQMHVSRKQNITVREKRSNNIIFNVSLMVTFCNAYNGHQSFS